MKLLRRAGLPLFVASCLLLSAWRGGYWAPQGPRSWTVDPRSLAVHDGDTFLWEGRELRLLGVDTPEKAAPWFDGDQEPWASQATEFARRRLRGARRVRVLSMGRLDLHGRELAHVLVDDEPLAVLLARAGLAYPTIQRFGDQGFPQIAARLLREAQPPAFEAPWRWRRAHRLD